MTDSVPAETAPPPKKRTFFKKAAWQTQPKAEEGKERDIFSHSNEFKDIAAEENRRQQEERRRKEEERKRKAEERQEQKRRKLSYENEDVKVPVGRSGSSTRSRNESKA